MPSHSSDTFEIIHHAPKIKPSKGRRQRARWCLAALLAALSSSALAILLYTLYVMPHCHLLLDEPRHPGPSHLFISSDNRTLARLAVQVNFSSHQDERKMFAELQFNSLKRLDLAGGDQLITLSGRCADLQIFVQRRDKRNGFDYRATFKLSLATLLQAEADQPGHEHQHGPPAKEELAVTPTECWANSTNVEFSPKEHYRCHRLEMSCLYRVRKASFEEFGVLLVTGFGLQVDSEPQKVRDSPFYKIVKDCDLVAHE